MAYGIRQVTVRCGLTVCDSGGEEGSEGRGVWSRTQPQRMAPEMARKDEKDAGYGHEHSPNGTPGANPRAHLSCLIWLRIKQTKAIGHCPVVKGSCIACLMGSLMKSHLKAVAA